jgi:hypothetical protein
LAFAVQAGAGVGRKDAAHERVATAVPQPGRVPLRLLASGRTRTWMPRPISSSICSPCQ